MRPSSYLLVTETISAVQPMSATPSSEERTMPNGYFCSRHSGVSSLVARFENVQRQRSPREEH